MFITTAGRTDLHMIIKAKLIANELSIPYLDRNKQSVKTLQLQAKDACIVVGKNRLELYPYGEKEPFFFHPNSAMFRLKRLLNGEHDPFLQATGLEEGMTMLDCTLGLAADSIVASFAVGENGQVIGVEADQFLAFIVSCGLQVWDSGIPQVNEAMKRIQLHFTHCAEFLKTQPDNNFDVVYFDPMFEEPVIESDGIKSLSQFALHEDLDDKIINEALRVTRKRVVLKDHFRSSRFERYGFEVIRRKSAKFHYGILEK